MNAATKLQKDSSVFHSLSACCVFLSCSPASVQHCSSKALDQTNDKFTKCYYYFLSPQSFVQLWQNHLFKSFSTQLILLGDIFDRHVCHFISVFFFYEANAFGNEAQKRQTWMHRRQLQKPSGARVLNWLSCPAGCYYAAFPVF